MRRFFGKDLVELICKLNLAAFAKLCQADRTLGLDQVFRERILKFHVYEGLDHGNRSWKVNGRFHRGDDLPAFIDVSDGGKRWYKNGKKGRDDDLPAYVHPSGLKRWYIDGLVDRRDDKPALISPDGLFMWRRKGKLHRDGGKPAVICEHNSLKEWWIHGVEQQGPTKRRKLK